MTKKEYGKVFDEVKMDNLTIALDAKFYTITDASCNIEGRKDWMLIAHGRFMLMMWKLKISSMKILSKI